MNLRKKFMPTLYNSMRGKTNSASSGLRSYVLGEYGNKCAVCGTQDNVSVVHILKHKEDCAALTVEWGASNFIALCGTDGEVGTCHSYFDNFQMSFVYVEGFWRVVGGKPDYREKIVNLATNTSQTSFAQSLCSVCDQRISLVG
jgi:hypothetical protein